MTTTAEWLDIGWIDQIPVRGSRTIQVAGGDDIAVFRTAEGKVFALLDRCPHKHGRLSQGIVHGGAVACPLHPSTRAAKLGAILESLAAQALLTQPGLLPVAYAAVETHGYSPTLLVSAPPEDGGRGPEGRIRGALTRETACGGRTSDSRGAKRE